MSKYVPDVSSRRWVIIAPQRLKRPEDKQIKVNKKCPFCPGNEDMTPHEVLRFGGGEPGKKGWKVRVIPNKYPITDIHEVIIHTPSHGIDIKDLPLSHIALIFKAYRQRYNFYRRKGHVLIFDNHGEHSGASLTHSHSQLVVIPSQINLDTLVREPLNNIVLENKFFYVYCPDFSQWPYEVWISPKKQDTFFGDISDEAILDLSQILKKMLAKMAKIYYRYQFDHTPFAYNYYIYPQKNWYMRIIPRFIHRAGFELGTGLSVNVIDPIDASLEYKGYEPKIARVLRRLKVK